MRRAVATLSAFALVAALCVGCIKQGFTTKVAADGSGTVTYKIGLSKQMMAMMKAMQQGQGDDADPFANMDESLKEFPEAWGAKAEKWSDDKFEGVKVSLKFTSLEMLKEQLARLTEGAGEAGGPKPIKDWVVTQEGDKVTIGLTIDTRGAADQGQAGGMGGMGGADAMKDATISFEVEMPKIDSFEAAGVGVKAEGTEKVTWTVGLTSNKEYKISATGSGFKAAPKAEGTEEGGEKKEDKKEGTDGEGF